MKNQDNTVVVVLNDSSSLKKYSIRELEVAHARIDNVLKRHYKAQIIVIRRAYNKAVAKGEDTVKVLDQKWGVRYTKEWLEFNEGLYGITDYGVELQPES